MNIRLVFASLCVFWSIPSSAQVAGEFYLEKATFAPGEPVFLYLKLVNHGPGTVEIFASDPEQPFCSGNSIRVLADSAVTPQCPSFTDSGCVTSGPLSTPSPLQPGRSRVERFLLNFNHEIDAPGGYSVEAQRGAPGTAHSKLHFQVDSNLVFPPSQLATWVDQLKSSDREMRLEAARTLASLGPQSIEALLLGFSNDPDLRRYAPLAFHRLNTARSLEALAALMKASGPGAFEYLEAARYLAETNDQKWYPLLLDAAEKNAAISNCPAYAAELGGAKMLPELVNLAKNPQSRLQAVMAMGSTGSKEAIPILLDLLKDPDVGVRDRAGYSLGLLTHRTSTQISKSSDTGGEYMQWKEWWASEGATAPIYKDTECGEMVPLP